MKHFNILFAFVILCAYAEIKDVEDIINLKKFGYNEQKILEIIKSQGGIQIKLQEQAQLKEAGFSNNFLAQINKSIALFSIPPQLKKFYQKPLSPETKNIHALVIAVDEYESNQLPKLPICKNDAWELTKFLLSIGVPVNQIHFLMGSKATRENINKTVEQTSLKNKELYFFYSGHGLYSTRTGFFFACANTNIDQLETTAYGIDQLRHHLEKIKNKAILFLDISHSNKTKSINVNTNIEQITQGRGLEQKAYNSISNLKQNTKPLLVITSCEPKQVSHKNKTTSVFMHSLLTGLKGKADKNKDRKVSLKEMFEFINSDIPDKSYLAQRPSYSYSDKWLWSKEQGFTYKAKKKHFKKPRQIILESARYQKHKKNGKKWDIGIGKIQLPDSFICISVPDENKWEIVFTSKVKKNQLTPLWKQKTKIYIFPGNKIGIDIWDKDLRNNDLMASKIYTITTEDVNKGVIELDLKTVKLVLRLKVDRSPNPHD